MNKADIISKTIAFVKDVDNAEGGHDWFHIERSIKKMLICKMKFVT
jgi:uncharacterized protein